MDLIIKNGNVIFPNENQLLKADIYCKNGKIFKIIKDKTNSSEEQSNNSDAYDNLSEMFREAKIIDATDLIVAPGLVDVHVHFRDPGFTNKEDIISGSMAAKKGGFTTVVLMANTKPVVDNIETLKYVLDKAKSTDIRIESCATVTLSMEGKNLTNMEELKSFGAVGFTDDGKPIMDSDIVRQAMVKARNLNCPISFHEENPDFIVQNGINHGMASEYFKIEGSKREAEISLVKRDLELALETGVDINIQHISSKEAVELVREAKKKANRNNIHAEATPHHFSLTEEALIKYGTNAKMNPPLRTEEDRLGIIEGLKDGTIEIIATDHAPHTKEEKQQEITKAPSGIIGLETALPLAITNLYRTGQLSLLEIIKKMTYNPAKLYHLDRGDIEINANADFCIFSADEKRIFDKFESKSDNSPFKGAELYGVVKYTICNGKIVYKDALN